MIDGNKPRHYTAHANQSPVEISHSTHSFVLRLMLFACEFLPVCRGGLSLTQQGDDDDNDDGLCFVNFYPTLNMAVIVKRNFPSRRLSAAVNKFLR